jgi:hypothetical protein
MKAMLMFLVLCLTVTMGYAQVTTTFENNQIKVTTTRQETKVMSIAQLRREIANIDAQIQRMQADKAAKQKMINDAKTAGVVEEVSTMAQVAEGAGQGAVQRSPGYERMMQRRAAMQENNTTSIGR